MTRSCEPHGPETSREAEMEQQALKVTNVSKYFGGGFDYRKLVSWCLPVTASRSYWLPTVRPPI